MKLLSPAKINLFLHVTGRRTDGYHDLFTLMCGVGLYDILEFDFNVDGVSIHCEHPDVPADSSNLAYRAARLFFDRLGKINGHIDPCVGISLTKQIPVAGGLGGGSSNAATVLIGLNRYFNFPFSQIALREMGLSLGADVPFFILGRPAIATGVGEVLTPIDNLFKFYVLLVNPRIHVATADVYKNLNLGLTNSQKLNKESFFRVRKLNPVRYLWNDLETVTASKFPEIQKIKEALLANGADGALMTGSGPTVFGLFYDLKAAQNAQSVLSKYSSWRLFLAESIGG
ncbi:MAG: 4-(cytidine 5'-diphospho)-2-C-methyl-D-erythritol kinase [Desulfobacterales bacterium]|jgi:4-diphosphocytidyl-2-C-methyl-D-erythritol kinase|nr:4-(cytidine 5'-diphospho)-2-C-methyl-D-erythritol kinase [Desulfobacterales bacterium]